MDTDNYVIILQRNIRKKKRRNYSVQVEAFTAETVRI